MYYQKLSATVQNFNMHTLMLGLPSDQPRYSTFQGRLSEDLLVLHQIPLGHRVLVMYKPQCLYTKEFTGSFSHYACTIDFVLDANGKIVNYKPIQCKNLTFTQYRVQGTQFETQLQLKKDWYGRVEWNFCPTK